jgi:hypothetical protein
MEQALNQLDKEISVISGTIEHLKEEQSDCLRLFQEAELRLTKVMEENKELISECDKQESEVADALKRFGGRDPRVQAVVMWQQKKLQYLRQISGIEEIDFLTDRSQLVVQFRPRKLKVANGLNQDTVRVTWTESGVHVSQSNTGELISCGDLSRAGIEPNETGFSSKESCLDNTLLRQHQIESRVNACQLRDEQLKLVAQEYPVQIIPHSHAAVAMGAGAPAASWPCMSIVQITLPLCELLIELDECNCPLRILFHEMTPTVVR